MPKHWWARFAVGRTPVADPLQAADRPDPRFETEWRPAVKARALLLLGGLGAWAVAVLGQLVFLQVVSHAHYAERAAVQQIDKVTIEAPRGPIVDRNGKLLATSIQSYELTAYPENVKNPAAEAKELCAALGDCGPGELASITASLGKRNEKGDLVRWVRLRSSSEMRLNAALGVQALIERRAKAKAKVTLSLEPKGSRRLYTKMDLAAQVIGFITPDAHTGEGVEYRRNAELSGVPGQSLVLVDGLGGEMGTRVTSAPKPGATVELTIDVGLQHIAESALRDGIAASGAEAGAAVVLAAGTGEILASASYPSFDPNQYRFASGNEIRNRVVQDAYEPGSTMKIVTAAAALNERLLTPDTIIDCRPGVLPVPGRSRPIREDNGHDYGPLTFEDVIVRSSNVGAVKTGQRIGPELLLQYVRRMGFGQRIAPDFGAAEHPGYVAQGGSLAASSLASLSMGYEASVTPIQMAAAASVVANNGDFIEPHVVRAVITDGRREEVQPRVVRQVFTPETAATLMTIMEEVVVRGTGTPAALERFQVAGKTGTAKKVVDGRYSEVDFNVSFVGIVPSRRPRFVILVVVDSPHKVKAYGGSVAGPIFRRIADAALQYVGVTPSINPAPPVIVTGGRRLLAPPPAATVMPARLDSGGRPVMPDLRGLSLRDALRQAAALGLAISSTQGDGVVVFQSPEPGQPLTSASRGVLQARRDQAPGSGGHR